MVAVRIKIIVASGSPVKDGLNLFTPCVQNMTVVHPINQSILEYQTIKVVANVARLGTFLIQITVERRLSKLQLTELPIIRTAYFSLKKIFTELLVIRTVYLSQKKIKLNSQLSIGFE